MFSLESSTWKHPGSIGMKNQMCGTLNSQRPFCCPRPTARSQVILLRCNLKHFPAQVCLYPRMLRQEIHGMLCFNGKTESTALFYAFLWAGSFCIYFAGTGTEHSTLTTLRSTHSQRNLQSTNLTFEVSVTFHSDTFSYSSPGLSLLGILTVPKQTRLLQHWDLHGPAAVVSPWAIGAPEDWPQITSSFSFLSVKETKSTLPSCKLIPKKSASQNSK